ncbi:cupin domain-containing protein [Nocardia donostiensis]|uniref:Cupin type-2 domain-containing protein n=1 Tax=Nocardia donostiensis TaxID=1538463 RepID=A0A1W0B616_9NOCA|nr:cupin domain-containing protein [Nocardia donostiensis]ONM46079.1 hypothetical protein B0T46_24820 [Nocardia donostiensis]OQS12418.1 hypothetical protein B0T36_25295 [Nocardia donostiensis]OQS17967.1 hypothetical protein B0T44_21960 [Nocardia donostiensis]
MTDTSAYTLITDIATWTEPEPDRPAVTKLATTPDCTLVRLCLRAGQGLDDHRTAGPVAIHCLSGAITVGVVQDNPVSHTLDAGAAIHLSAGLPHNVRADSDSIVLLTVFRPQRTAA